MSALLVITAALALIEPQAARQAPPATPPAPSQIGDEPGVLTGHGPVRNTPVPGVRFRTAAPGENEAPAERRLGGDPVIPIPFPGPGSSGGGGGGPTGPGGSGGTIPMSNGDEPGTAPGGVRPPRPPR